MFLFLKEVWYLLLYVMGFDEISVMFVVFGLIDVVMILNLLIMVIVGGYEMFVLWFGIEGYFDEFEWFDYVNVGVLKVKLLMVLISILLIYLLKIFINFD